MRSMLLAACLGVAAAVTAQPIPCPVKGIQTNPYGPANPENPGRLNSFNWFAPYAVQPPYAGGNEYFRINWDRPWPSYLLASPYRQWDNSLIDHLTARPDQPADGWELIAQGLGYDHYGQPLPSTGTNVPYLILYNRFTSTLRVFAAVGQRPADYGYTLVTLRFTEGPGLAYKSGLLNRISAPATALLDAPAGLGSYRATGRFINTFAKWFVAEFPLDYDPCTCQFDSRLAVDIGFVRHGRLDVTRTGPGGPFVWAINRAQAYDALDEPTMGGPPVWGAPDWAAFPVPSVLYQLRTQHALPGLQRLGLPALQLLTHDATLVQRRTEALNQLRSLLIEQPGFLRDGLARQPLVATALDGLDFALVGGRTGIGAQDSQLPVLAAQTGSFTSGSFITEDPLRTALIATPGSRYARTVAASEEYPYYNEVLGVFALLRRPVVERSLEVVRQQGQPVLRYRFRLREPLAFALNPAAGLALQDMQVALETEGQSYPTSLPLSDFSTYDAPVQHPDGPPTHLIRTAYYPAACLPDGTVTLDVPATCGTTFQPGAVSLKVLLNLRRTDAAAGPATQNVLLAGRYPATTVAVAPLPATPAPVVCTASAQPQSAAALATFCGSPAYQEAMRLDRPASSQPPLTAPPVPATISLYPNPVLRGQPVQLDLPTNGCLTLRLYDAAGRLVAQPLPEARYAAGPVILPALTSTLASGTYFCVATLDGQRLRAWRLVVK